MQAILHIGDMKCGSKSIQGWLAANDSLLRRHGFHGGVATKHSFYDSGLACYALDDADLTAEPRREHAIHALTLTAIAHVRTVDEYVARLERSHPRPELEEMRRRATEDAQRHADTTAMSLRESVQSRFTEAALRAAVQGDRSEEAPALALVLFALRQQDAADPAWEDVGRSLVAALDRPMQHDDISITDVD